MLLRNATLDVRLRAASLRVNRYTPAMAQFFFHARYGDTLFEDPEGAEWPDLDAARAEAIASARALAADDLRSNRPARNIQIEITDTTGQRLATVSVRDVATG